MVNRYLKYFKNTKGFTTLYVILFLAFFIPIMFFFTIDLPQAMSMNRKAKATLDNATSTAILQIDEVKASQGILSINSQEAKNIANKVISETFLLNDDLSIKDGSLLVDKPIITITVINDAKATPTYSTPNGTFKIENPSVVIYGEIPVKGGFFNFTQKTIKHTSIAQVQFRK